MALPRYSGDIYPAQSTPVFWTLHNHHLQLCLMTVVSSALHVNRQLFSEVAWWTRRRPFAGVTRIPGGYFTLKIVDGRWFLSNDIFLQSEYTLGFCVQTPPPPLGSSRQDGGLFFPTNCLTDKEEVCSSFKQLGEERPGVKASLLFSSMSTRETLCMLAVELSACVGTPSVFPMSLSCFVCPDDFLQCCKSNLLTTEATIRSSGNSPNCFLWDVSARFIDSFWSRRSGQ